MSHSAETARTGIPYRLARLAVKGSRTIGDVLARILLAPVRLLAMAAMVAEPFETSRDLPRLDIQIPGADIAAETALFGAVPDLIKRAQDDLGDATIDSLPRVLAAIDRLDNPDLIQDLRQMARSIVDGEYR